MSILAALEQHDQKTRDDAMARYAALLVANTGTPTDVTELRKLMTALGKNSQAVAEDVRLFERVAHLRHVISQGSKLDGEIEKTGKAVGVYYEETQKLIAERRHKQVLLQQAQDALVGRQTQAQRAVHDLNGLIDLHGDGLLATELKASPDDL